MNAFRILLVEDEHLIRLIMSEAMLDDGFDVTTASTGDEAMQHLRAGQVFDLLLTDIQLPGATDGLDVARAARNNAPKIPIIFTTGQPDRMDPWRPGLLDMFIAKPYRPSDVCAAVRRMVGASA
jgi:CheY-like chemotaxis protein